MHEQTPNDLGDVRVRVLPTRYVKEYRGTTAVKDREVPPDQWGIVMSLDEAVRLDWSTDAHFQVMRVPGFENLADHYPRVGRAWAINLWKDDDVPPEALPAFDVVVLDLDHGEKGSSTWETRPDGRPIDKSFLDLVADLRDRFGFAYYLSRTGARLIGRPYEPLTLDVYEDWYCRFLLHLDTLGFPVFAPDSDGHHIDASCYEVGRLFKLPLVPGSDPSGRNDWYRPDFQGTIDFEPGALLPWSFGRRRGGIGRPTEPVPTDPRTFNKTDLRPLRNREYWDVLTRPEPIGPPGGRHDPMISIAGSVAKTLRTSDPRTIYGVMYPSVKAAVTPEDREADLLGELWEVAHYVAASVEADEEADEELRAARAVVRNDAYSRIAELTGCEPAQAVGRVVLATNKGVYYPFDEDLQAYAPVPYKLNQLAQALARHCPNLVQLRTRRGTYQADRTLALRYSSPDISEVRYTYGSDEVRADLDARRLYLPAALVRDDLQPRYHQDVAQWLALLAGEHQDDLLNWLARFPDLTRPLCALYLRGEKGTGKNVLARGLSSIWGVEPVEYGILGERFQSPLLRSPVLHADESVQLSHFRAGHGTSIFRKILGDGSHQIEEKGMDHVWVEGFVRVLVTANNTDALKIREDLSADDVRAIQERVGYIDVPDDAAAPFIASLSWAEIDSMIEQRIPEHVLFLARTRTLSDDVQRSRFASWASSFARTVKLDIGKTRIVAEVIGRWFERLTSLENPDLGLFVKDRLLYVQSSALSRIWKSIVDDTANRLPNSRALTTALRALAPEGDDKPNAPVRMDGQVVRAWTVDPDKVAAVLDELDVDSARFRMVFDLDAPAAPSPTKPQSPLDDAINAYWAEETLKGEV